MAILPAVKSRSIRLRPDTCLRSSGNRTRARADYGMGFCCADRRPPGIPAAAWQC